MRHPRFVCPPTAVMVMWPNVVSFSVPGSVAAGGCCGSRQTEDSPVDGTTPTLTPAAKLAHDNRIRIPNESVEYRAARTALLAEEIELRRHIERVAAQRRALPPGGAVTGDYRVGSSRVDLQACKLEYSIVSPK